VFPALAIAFIVVPIVEIAVLLRVGGAIGGLETLVLVIAMAVAGASLARHQGLTAMRKLQESMATGREVGRSMIESVLVLVAAVLMITPGFVTDGVGLLLLLPPVRAAVAAAIQRSLADKIADGHVRMYGPGFGHGPGAGPTGRPEPGPGRRDDQEPPPPGVIDV